ncbi:Glycosyltransferase involved in cell wall bisynthesis [Roseovarius marisflavi]|uniref:Glycosyltransferase involved in cell wall bisynthesis n=1 Tax=Roseovarius marisflavi TaxID=1054996 RepID=A0A1M7BLK0_9RHOB|nr:glycosyltransferase [Roseovarius marisflavi]SHL55912.1 Glycosyltransferase involved in cell wall bisynthesis [Roseovarius marisflavi]
MSGPIAYLTGEYPRATDTFIQREVAALRAHGMVVETCSMRRTGPEHHTGPEQRLEACQTFHVLEATTSPLRLIRAHLAAFKRPKRWFRALCLAWRTSSGGIKSTLYQLIYLAEAAVLADHLRRRGITHLHNHIAKSSCTVAMLMSEMSGIPFSFTLHGPDIFFEPYRWRLDEKIARARFVACISDFCRSQAMAFSAPKHWAKLHIVHCGVDPARYDAAAPDAPAHLLFVGRLAAVKGVPVLFAALSDLLPAHPDLHLTLVGDGPERGDLERVAQAMGLAAHLTFAGYRSQSEVAGLLAQSTALVLPSFAEGVPVVLMEAMAARLPVITTRIAGVPELVEHGKSGFVVAPGDEGALSAALALILDDADLRRAMGEAGRARVLAEFTSDAEGAWLAELFEGYATGTPPLTKRPAARA